MDRSTGTRIFTALNHGLMLLLIFLTAYPIYYVVIASFSNPVELSLNTGALILPLQPYTLSAYKLVLQNPMVGRGYLNTLIILIGGLAVNITLTVMGAYFLTLKDVMLKIPVTFFIIFTMYFSGGLVPTYLNIRDLGMFDSLWALILPTAINTTNLIIMKTAFQAVPDSLVESARLDGAAQIKILFRIMIPLAVPTIMVLVLYYGVGHWNAWFNASIYLQTRNKFPLQLVMRNILLATQASGDMMGGLASDEMAQMADLVKYALIVVSTTPILMLYPFLQKYFVKGVMVGAIKG